MQTSKTRFTYRRSIKTKITGGMLLTSVLALLVASVVFIAYDSATHKRHMADDLRGLAEILALNTAASLSFLNDRDAAEVLSSLEARQQITKAGIYRSDGTLFTEYYRSGHPKSDQVPASLARELETFNNETLCVSRFILLDDEQIGAVYIQTDLSELKARRRGIIIIAGVVLLIASMAALFFISLVQKTISDPILELAQTARVVSDDNDYSIRATERSEDEVGFLTRSFNKMLDQIEEQDSALKQTHAKLREQASKREKELLERKRAEDALSASERRFRDLFDNAPDMYITLNQGGLITDFNERGLASVGYKRKEVVGRPITDLISAEDVGQVESDIKKVSDGRPPRNAQARMIAKDGTVFWVIKEFSVNRKPNGGIQSIRVICHDITARKKLQEELGRAQRLETAGRIAGQIAHDFNNLLGPLAAYPTLIREDLPANHPVVEMANEMEQAALKIAEINQQLLSLGRRGHYATMPLSLNDIITKALTSQGIAGRAGIAIRTDLADELMLVKVGDAQLTRALANLFNNAVEAMNGGGTLTICTHNTHLDDDLDSHSKIKHGNYVRINITDTGCGISPETADHIFDPFFTTKAMDRMRGSGLGLSVVHGVITDHNGYITMKSEVEKGTTFSIFLPAAQNQEPYLAKIPQDLAGGSESILIIDDDPVQRKVTGHLLKRLGYQTEIACSGKEAIALTREISPDLLIIDMVMEGMDGAETYRRILEFRPGQRAIILSGYAKSKRVTEALRLGAGRFVSKPVSLQGLANAVREELDGIRKHPSKTSARRHSIRHAE